VQIGEKEWARLPAHLQALFVKLPNPGSEEVVAGFPRADSARASGNSRNPVHGRNGSGTSYEWGAVGRESIDYRATGSAARFFYCAKASRSERGPENRHPTVKPIALMRWLVRLVTPPGGLVLDPFAGSGTTGIAAAQEGFRFLGIEREAEYVEIARQRIQRAADGLA